MIAVAGFKAFAVESFLLLPLVALPLESFLLSLALLALVVSWVGWGFDGMMAMVWVRGRCFNNGVKQSKGHVMKVQRNGMHASLLLLTQPWQWVEHRAMSEGQRSIVQQEPSHCLVVRAISLESYANEMKSLGGL